MEELESLIVDVVYDDLEIYHVLEPNEEGIRGVPISCKFMRDTVADIRVRLANHDQTKIDAYISDIEIDLIKPNHLRYD